MFFKIFDKKVILLHVYPLEFQTHATPVDLTKTVVNFLIPNQANICVANDIFKSYIFLCILIFMHEGKISRF